MSNLILSKAEYLSLCKHFKNVLLNYAKLLRKQCETTHICRIFSYELVTETIMFSRSLERCASLNMTNMISGLKSVFARQDGALRYTRIELFASIINTPTSCISNKVILAHRKFLDEIGYNFNKSIHDQEFEALLDNFGDLFILINQTEKVERPSCSIM